jgi:hypothetical protein
MASGAQTDPWGNFLRRSRHEYDSRAVPDAYPGPRSATWLRQLTHSLGIVTAERGIAGATRYPSAQTAGNSRNAVKEPHIRRPTQKSLGSVSITWQAVGASTSIEQSLALFMAKPQNAYSRPGHQWTQGLLMREKPTSPEMGVILGDNKAREPLVLEQGLDSPAFVLTDRSPVERTTSAKRPRWFNE